ncbi:MAG: DUF4391 domain-containing protein [Xanthomonadales bacterium]|nr:DUF4391 domain-containing protein [Xanthomonadales bacterium]
MMSIFDLPQSTLVNKVIPKNTFHPMASGKIKKQLTDIVSKITWKNKLSSETINLSGKTVDEIQIFEIELKSKSYIKDVTNVIDRNIPYTIIFLMTFEGECYVSSSLKHNNPKDPDSAVIDCEFHSDWINKNESPHRLILNNSLDDILKRFCLSLIGIDNLDKNISNEDLIKYVREKDSLEKEISTLENKIKTCKQFNQKVELNSIKIKKIQVLDNLVLKYLRR